MDNDPIEDELPSGDDADWLETQFFREPSPRNHDLDWGAVEPMPRSERRAMHATIGMFTIAAVGLIAFVVYANLIMPAPAALDGAAPVLPPSAASVEAPNG